MFSIIYYFKVEGILALKLKRHAEELDSRIQLDESERTCAGGNRSPNNTPFNWKPNTRRQIKKLKINQEVEDSIEAGSLASAFFLQNTRTGINILHLSFLFLF